MRNSKKIMAVLLATSILAACGEKKEEAVEPVEQQQEVKVEVAAEANAFKAFASAQMDDFVKDTQLLATLVKEGKLEEAQKLYPLVTMYYERMQPITSSFEELDRKINGPLTAGKESEGTGFERLAFGLFEEKKTAGYEEVTQQLVTDVKELQQALPTTDITQTNVLASSVAELDQFVKQHLTNTSVANNEVYLAKAQTETTEEVVKIFMQRTSAESAAKATEAISDLNEVIAYFEVGKEDYVNYSFFTSTQKEELSSAFTNVQTALQQMNETLK